jgi:hypothetical protein
VGASCAWDWAFGSRTLTVAVESGPETKEKAIQKTIAVAGTERYSGLIYHYPASSSERIKQDGNF